MGNIFLSGLLEKEELVKSNRVAGSLVSVAD